MARLPISNSDFLNLSEWLAERTGVSESFFISKISNKFPGLSISDELSSVSGFHLYIEASNISSDTQWYGDLETLHDGKSDILVSILPPKEFQGARYYQYAGVISGTPF